METIILTLHIIVCVLLILLVLLQAGKEGMGVIFGGGNSTVFGSSGAGGALTKLTAFMAVIFICTSLGYTYVTSVRPSNESTILNVQIEEPAVPAQNATPATPEAPKPAGASDAADAATPQPTGSEPPADTPKPADAATPQPTGSEKPADAPKPEAGKAAGQ